MDAIATIRVAKGEPLLAAATDLTTMRENRASGDAWKRDDSECAMCSCPLGGKLGKAETRWHCKHCGASVCIKCAADDSKRVLPKFGFSSPVRCCLDCAEVVTAQEAAVAEMEAALDPESGDTSAVLALLQSCRLISPDYESKFGITPLGLALRRGDRAAATQLLTHALTVPSTDGGDGGGEVVTARVDFVGSQAAGYSTPLRESMQSRPADLDQIKFLLQQGATAAAVTPDGDSALMTATVCLATAESSCDEERFAAFAAIIDLLLASADQGGGGVDIDADHSGGERAGMRVIMECAEVAASLLATSACAPSSPGPSTAIAKLLACGASVATRDDDGNTALW